MALNAHGMKKYRSFLVVFFIFTLALLTSVAKAQLPFKYDNTTYKAVYIKEAFTLMNSMPSHLLIDVRSPGEYDDTSRSTVLNIGRIKGSVNIPIDSIRLHLAELKKHIDEPIFVYCSHSQRSRRVSKMLADSGFKHIYNINGGMSLMNTLNDTNFVFKDRLANPNLAYRNLASTDAYSLMKSTSGLVIIDIRTPAEFASRDTLAGNNIGHLKNAINIPQPNFAAADFDPEFPKDSPILLYDLGGVNSMDVVASLKAKGYHRIYNLYDGLFGYIGDHRLDKTAIAGSVTDPPAYGILDPRAGIDLLKQHPDLVVLDTRPTEEFENHAKMSHANLGRIKGAISVPVLADLDAAIQNTPRSATILIYGSFFNLDPIVANELLRRGYKNTNLLTQGLYGFVWSVFNAENCRDGKEFLVDHEGLY
jgi:rhodanese-related sulfurtransferase